MRHLLLSLILLINSSTFITYGQINSESAPGVLEDLYGRLVNNYDDIARIRINDSIRLIIDNYVISDTVFNHRFSNLKYLGQITSSDSLVKIITWNLVLSGSPGRYYCYLIKKQGAGKKNSVFRLSTSYREEPIRTDTIYTEENWYGALYYDLKPYTIGNLKLYILLGIDYGNLLISRKIVDVLNFTEGDSIIFGKRWFSTGNEIRFRDVFEYASNGMMSLRFTSDKSIVFDHLVPFSPAMKDDRQYYGPDYSYDAYHFENGLWKLMINVDARNKE